MKLPAVYIMANKHNGTLYTGVTSDLVRRVFEHRQGIKANFTSRYNCKILVYFEVYDDMRHAIEREKKIKDGSRQNKISLIQKINPGWNDLLDEII